MQILIASPKQNLMTFYKLYKLPANNNTPRMTNNTENVTSLCNSYYVAYKYTQNEYYVVKLAEKCVCLCVGGWFVVLTAGLQMTETVYNRPR